MISVVPESAVLIAKFAEELVFVLLSVLLDVVILAAVILDVVVLAAFMVALAAVILDVVPLAFIVLLALRAASLDEISLLI